MTAPRGRPGAVVAVAGRRIDAAGAEPARFASARVEAVRQAIVAALDAEGAGTVVASAACGADLLALEAAEQLGLRRRIVLPFAPARFRASSVTDRPGRWAGPFDRLLAAAETQGDLVVLGGRDDAAAAYRAANCVIVHEAERLAREAAGGGPEPRPVALIVWEGRSRGAADATDGLLRLARARGFRVRGVSTRG